MPRHPTGNPKTVIEHLWEHHEEICRRLVIGEKVKDIAASLKITPQHISTIRNSPVAQAYMAQITSDREVSTAEVHKAIVRLTPRAIKAMEEVMSQGISESAKVSAAKDVLDRAGFGAPKRVENIHSHMHLTKSDIEELQAAARAETEAQGKLIDVEYNVVEENVNESSQV